MTKPKLITLHLKNRRETDDAKYRRIGRAINLRKNVSRAALNWYRDRQRSHLKIVPDDVEIGSRQHLDALSRFFGI